MVQTSKCPLHSCSSQFFAGSHLHSTWSWRTSCSSTKKEATTTNFSMSPVLPSGSFSQFPPGVITTRSGVGELLTLDVELLVQVLLAIDVLLPIFAGRHLRSSRSWRPASTSHCRRPISQFSPGGFSARSGVGDMTWQRRGKYEVRYRKRRASSLGEWLEDASAPP